MAKIKMCETGCGERARFRSLQGYDLCRTCYVERRVGEVEPEVQAYRARQPNPSALPTREQVEAVLPEGWRLVDRCGWDANGDAWVEGFCGTDDSFTVHIPYGSEHRALDIIRERVAEVVGRERGVATISADDTPEQARDKLTTAIRERFEDVERLCSAEASATPDIRIDDDGSVPVYEKRDTERAPAPEAEAGPDPYATRHPNERHITEPVSDLDARIAAVRVDEPGRAPWDWDAEDSEELW